MDPDSNTLRITFYWIKVEYSKFVLLL